MTATTYQSGRVYPATTWGACWLNHADAEPTTGAELAAVYDHLIAVGHAPAAPWQYVCRVYRGHESHEYQSRLTFHSGDCRADAAEVVARVLNEYYVIRGSRQRVAVDGRDRRTVVLGAPYTDVAGHEIGEFEPHDWM